MGFITQSRLSAPLLVATAVVGLSTAIIPFIGGYGTVLSQLVMFNAWALVAATTSQYFADHHHGVVLFVALILNLGAFLIVALPIWLLCKNRKPSMAPTALAMWCVFYLACLFVIFRATDGP